MTTSAEKTKEMTCFNNEDFELKENTYYKFKKSIFHGCLKLLVFNTLAQGVTTL